MWVSLNLIVNCLKINKINLFIASKWGHEGTVKLLIDANANANIRDSKGWTALKLGKSLFNC